MRDCALFLVGDRALFSAPPIWGDLAWPWFRNLALIMAIATVVYVGKDSEYELFGVNKSFTPETRDTYGY